MSDDWKCALSRWLVRRHWCVFSCFRCLLCPLL